MANPTAVQDYDAVVAAVTHYVNGGRTGNSSEMRKAFAEQASFFGYVGPDLVAGPIQLLYDWVDANGAAQDLELRFASVDVTGSAASVRLEMDNWQSHRFTDYLSLVKIDGTWKIVNKTFYMHP
jgi:hypothetical protein